MSSTIPIKNIPETFAGADVFITGGSGFMGKVLIEKLIRSCPDIGRVFVLLRPRRGRTPDERLQELVQVPLFDVIRATCPNDIRKIVPISGDCSELKLGLDEESLKRMENVQFVFHAAASVRFDDPLEKAILLNTRGTREVILWAKTLKNLKAMVHISTTYSNPEIFDVEERIYPAKMDWRKAIELAETLDPEMLETLSPKLSGFAPNTYTFTKGLAEHICNDYHQELPLVIFRPSVVTGSEAEPFPGWIDNFNGPVGLLMGCGTGVLRTGKLNLENKINCIPVDVSINAIMIAAWKRTYEPEGTLTIYNSAAEKHKTADYSFLTTEGHDIYMRMPVSQVFCAPGGHNAFDTYSYYLLFFLYQLLPSACADLALKLSGRKPFLLKLQRKIFNAQISLKHFTDNEWEFKTDNFRSLANDLNETDRETFNISYLRKGTYDYFEDCILGARRYLMKEPDSTIPSAIKNMNRLVIIYRTAQAAFFGFVMYVLYQKVLLWTALE
ncbi:fatty acyl-CoA reductase 1-like [Culex pipiens pallens]|uniref:fatty acyl-CoA reductase 1-like n=1 Tax=Culex pipiens pallens TaxID=42434 RepID=UPI001954B07E|nr:fatty acyl-CoA reductase 1-like [Culex pipiens pallens]